MKKNSSGYRGDYQQALLRRSEHWVCEGYYAVGFALRMPDAIVYAFDIDPTAQHYCANLAKLNCVS
jgi:hypothetical protein